MTPLVLAAVALNWVGVSITTTKTGEDLYQHYFRTETQCWESKLLPGDEGDRICIPIPELPQVFFDTQVERCIANANRYFWLDSKIEAASDLCRKESR